MDFTEYNACEEFAEYYKNKDKENIKPFDRVFYKHKWATVAEINNYYLLLIFDKEIKELFQPCRRLGISEKRTLWVKLFSKTFIALQDNVKVWIIE